MEFKWMMVIGVILLGVLFQVPYAKRVVYFPYLYAHEFGHSVMALLTRVSRQRMEFNLDNGSGQVRVRWNPRSKLKILLIGSIGYIFPVIVVYMGVLSLQKGWENAYCIGLMIMLIYGALNTRSFVGWILVTAGVAAGGYTVYNGDWSSELAIWVITVTIWIVSMGCIETLRRLVVNYRALEPEENGDAYLLSNMIGLPLVMWVMFFVAVNAFITVILWWHVRGLPVQDMFKFLL